MRVTKRSRALALPALAALTVLPLVASWPSTAEAGPPQPSHPPQSQTLPLGDSSLPEIRSTTDLAPGVRVQTIIRGTTPAAEDEIATTTRGPWRVHVLTIDPRRARGTVEAVRGPDLAGTEPVSELSAQNRALAAVNASFFTFAASQEYPGDPVGLGIYDGRLESQPEGLPGELGLVLDSRTLKAKIDTFSWTGELRGRAGTLSIEAVDHPPVVPTACADLPDQATCAEDGATVLFDDGFAATTPAGAGFEAVLDRRGCVVQTAEQRGVALQPGQRSVQATGSDVAAARRLLVGCLRLATQLSGSDGRTVPITRHTQAVNGRQELVRNGRIVVPDIDDDFFARNPRTVAGTTADGVLTLIVIDGRQQASVGTTLAETAAVAKALGLRNALNLDGGGSSTMVAGGAVINLPSGGIERKVGDGLVYVDRRR